MADITAESLGKIIQKLRIKQNLTQKQLANLLCVSDKAVSKWESGGGFPEITQLPALSKVFGVPVDYLLKANSKGIVIAGNILVDVINIIEKYPQKNMLANICETSFAVGGCVPNTAINLAKIDPNIFVSAIGKIGNDDYGKFVLGEMTKCGIDTSMVKISETMQTGSDNVMSEKVSGERTFFLHEGANAELSADDFDSELLDCEIFHIGYILLLKKLDEEDSEYGTKLARLLCRLQKKGIKTSFDVVSEDGTRYKEKILPAVKYCNYCIMNEIESCSVSGLPPRDENGGIITENIRKTMEFFIDSGVKDAIIVHCPEAGFYMNSAKNFVMSPSLKLPENYIKGSVGAGDAYAAASLYGFYNDYEPEKILEFASCAAACNLSKEDSISGMKPKEEIEKLGTIFEKRELKCL